MFSYPSPIGYLLLIFSCLLLTGNCIANPKSTVIRDVYIVSPVNQNPKSPHTVLIENGRVRAISRERLEGDKIIEGKGRFLIPGLIDSHVHLDSIPGYSGDDANLIAQAQARIPKSYLYFGFTTVLDLAAQPEFIARWNKQAIAPDARFCVPVSIANGYPLAWMPADQQFSPETSRYMLYDERQADVIPDSINPEEHRPRSLVKRIKADGAHCVKVFYETGFGRLKNLPVPTREMVNNLVTAAHAANLPVVLHGNSEAAYRFALETKVDFIAHGMWHWDKLTTASEQEQKRFFQRIVHSGKKIQPTIQVIHGEQELFNPEFFAHPDIKHVMPQTLIDWYKSDAGQWMKKQMAEEFDQIEKLDAPAQYSKVTNTYKKPLGQVTRFTQAIGKNQNTLIFGSDTPSGPFYTQFPGLNGRMEMQRWVDAGIDLVKVFNAFTIDNARAMGIDDDIGSVEVGKIANLLLLNQNPFDHIDAYDSIDTVILRGRMIKRCELSASR